MDLAETLHGTRPAGNDLHGARNPGSRPWEPHLVDADRGPELRRYARQDQPDETSASRSAYIVRLVP